MKYFLLIGKQTRRLWRTLQKKRTSKERNDCFLHLSKDSTFVYQKLTLDRCKKTFNERRRNFFIFIQAIYFLLKKNLLQSKKKFCFNQKKNCFDQKKIFASIKKKLLRLKKIFCFNQKKIASIKKNFLLQSKKLTYQKK